MFTWKILDVSAKDSVITHARYHVTATQNNKDVIAGCQDVTGCFVIILTVISFISPGLGNI